jgi:glycosyltransferase involved in cell wall biosynthesis
MVIASRTVETFSIAALEAMALARPMVMSDIGGAR